MNTVAEKVATLWPEIIMMIGAMVCLFLGLASTAKARRATAPVAGLTLVLAALFVPLMATPHSGVGLGAVAAYVKLAVIVVGFVLLLVAAKVPEGLAQVKRAESARQFEPGLNIRGEFFAFFLMSLTGAMLTAGADDLVWLFLALELTSLPTYVLVASSRDHIDSHESAVKYFFLGAMSAALFVYGFALIYGSTGFTAFALYNGQGEMVGGVAHAVRQQIESTGSVSHLTLAGLMLAVVGIGFKIAAVPMHFYAADVYQGASTSVTAFLAFVPKTAGFVALILLLGIVGWPLDRTPGIMDGGNALVILLWIMAALTMTVGNVLALVQNNVKRVLAYSSIAHSGYILVGLLAGTTLVREMSGAGAVQSGTQAVIAGALGNGLGGVLFYLVAYGLGTIAAFAVLGCLQRRAQPDDIGSSVSEAQTFDDLSGLIRTHPALAAVMVVSMISLIGLPPLVGFIGKLYLIGPAYHAGFVWLVIIMVINSAISAAYYLRIAGACVFGSPPDDDRVTAVDAPSRRVGAAIAALLTIGLGIGGAGLVNWTNQAASPIVVPGANPTTAHSDPDGDSKPNVKASTESRDQSRGIAIPRLSQK